MSWMNYVHPLFQPAYPDELNYTSAQRLVCGNNIFCLYDLYQTASEDFAMTTVLIDQVTRLDTLVLSKYSCLVCTNH